MLCGVTRYRELFPQRLKLFKVKKGASVDERQAYIVEIQCVIETSIDTFLMDSIYTALYFIELETQKSNLIFEDCLIHLNSSENLKYERSRR